MNNMITNNTGTGTNLGFEDDNKTMNPILYSKYESSLQLPTINTLVKGIFVSKNNSYATFSTAFKSDILVQLNSQELSLIDQLELDTEIDILVTSIVDSKKETLMYGSLHDVAYFNLNKNANEVLNSIFTKNESMIGVPIGYSIYGYDVAVNIDESEIVMHMPHLLTDINKLPNPESIIGQEIEFKLLEDNKLGYIASRKAHLISLAKKELKTLKIGEVYTGFVTGTISYAVFVQIGNLTGMVHESNLGDVAKEMLKNGLILPGMEIDVYLKDVNGMKLTLTQIKGETLWDTIKVGDILTGKITSVKDFNDGEYGVLVSFDYDTRGMIHSSNLANSESIKETLKTGNKIDVKILNIYKNKRQITLTTKF